MYIICTLIWLLFCCMPWGTAGHQKIVLFYVHLFGLRITSKPHLLVIACDRTENARAMESMQLIDMKRLEALGPPTQEEWTTRKSSLGDCWHPTRQVTGETMVDLHVPGMFGFGARPCEDPEVVDIKCDTLKAAHILKPPTSSECKRPTCPWDLEPPLALSIGEPRWLRLLCGRCGCYVVMIIVFLLLWFDKYWEVMLVAIWCMFLTCCCTLCFIKI